MNVPGIHGDNTAWKKDAGITGLMILVVIPLAASGRQAIACLLVWDGVKTRQIAGITGKKMLAQM